MLNDKRHFAGYVKHVLQGEPASREQMREWYDTLCAIYPDEAERRVQTTYLALADIHPKHLAEIHDRMQQDQKKV